MDTLSIVYNIISSTVSAIVTFARWFYFTFLPFVIQYIGIPLFVLGIILAIGFAGGTLLFTIIFLIFMYFFIKGTIFSSKP